MEELVNGVIKFFFGAVFTLLLMFFLGSVLFLLFVETFLFM